ncbi:PstS family phosphate ABC transporter substrate-binding protein [Anaerobacillus arseniciselenatis]|nr:substrate-binding domain-containing protein [Anaerobacillus arseniciselenatis]
MIVGVGEKVISTIFLTISLVFIGFIAAVYASLMGAVKFYTPFVIIVTVAVIIFSIMRIFKLGYPRILRISVISFTSLCIIAVATYEINQAYHNSFETLNDAEVNLREYAPFSEDSKLVSLPETATLKMEGQLPVLDGATALYPVYGAFVEATYPEKNYDFYRSEVMCSKTDQAYEKLINGDADIIFAAGPSKRQIDLAKKRGVELKLTPIGREAFVFFVNSRNSVEGLTIEQIQGIYSGEVTNWSEVGGNSASIRAFQRPDDSGSQTALQNLMEGKTLMTPLKEDVVAGMGGIIEQTAQYRNYNNALGYSFRYFSTDMIENDEIRHLKINGVPPSVETIRTGEYPLAAEFYAITAGSDNPNIDAFIEWILSPQGQYIIEETGYVPLNLN